ncbi:hypothetical protein MCOR27_008467 [Pyricularia oryzae]|nr:hypothetical protein MCOR01_009917 [Pyricularia oryzae]KAI6272200.1 hypothetical protein MCOR27_008467 [Pyricularia oryzae]KAI6276353.1 hypothetical protein MCOR26_005625 [Pyricularia oryzae]KAI6329537.1 hypothetical protein MCOR29_002177 [Pyricularia oryzae]KAI6460692.1 hypothetical protein MCOR15_005366 [Pyricularia oryzae]
MAHNNRQRSSVAASVPPQAPPPSTRNNEYFLPRDGIDREVITADICRYLGNDALVRPGHLERDGRVVQGYYITAYRNLTSAMIESLKEDSQKWVEEKRRAQGAQGAQMRYMDSSLRNPNAVSQHMTGVARDYPDSQAAYSESYGAGGQGGFGQYPSRDQGYAAPPPGSFPPREPVYADRQDPYGAQARATSQQYVSAGYGQQADGPYHATGMNRQYAAPPAPQQAYGDPMQITPSYPPTSQGGAYSPQAQQPYYAGAAPPPGAPRYDPQGVPATSAQPIDVFYGRASPAGSTGHSASGLEQHGSAPPSRREQHPRDHTRDHTRDRERDRHYSTTTNGRR